MNSRDNKGSTLRYDDNLTPNAIDKPPSGKRAINRWAEPDTGKGVSGPPTMPRSLLPAATMATGLTSRPPCSSVTLSPCAANMPFSRAMKSGVWPVEISGIGLRNERGTRADGADGAEACPGRRTYQRTPPAVKSAAMHKSVAKHLRETPRKKALLW